jgi:hypothetical protein
VLARSRIRLLSIGAVAMVAVALPVANAGSAPKPPKPSTSKPYVMNVKSPEPAGATDLAYTVTIKNTTGTQQIGSADVTIPTVPAPPSGPVPSDFQVVAGQAPTLDAASQLRGGTVTLSGKVLKLRNLNLPPDDGVGDDEAVTVTLGLTMPCLAGSYAWTVDARQSNDFLGLPGNTLGPVSGTLATTVAGSCRLRFVETPSGQPAGTEKTRFIRAEAFNPASTKLVTVEAVDASDPPQRLTWFNGPISVELAASTYPGELSNDPPTPETTTNGVRTFSGLSIDEAGLYRLSPTTGEPGFAVGLGDTSDDSDEFQIVDVVSPCNPDPGTCKTPPLSGANTSSTLSGGAGTDTGQLVLSLNLGPKPFCPTYQPDPPGPGDDWYEFQLTANRDKLVETSYNRAFVQTVGGPSNLEICFAAPADFAAKGGTTTFDYDGPGGPLTVGYQGLLENCPSAGPPIDPCVLARPGTSGGGAIVRFVVPAAWSVLDPRYN